jgi:nitrogen regulatory protein PII-like uncharacterized protein
MAINDALVKTIEEKLDRDSSFEKERYSKLMEKFISDLDPEYIGRAINILEYSGMPYTVGNFVRSYSMIVPEKFSESEERALKGLLETFGEDSPFVYDPTRRRIVVVGKIPKPETVRGKIPKPESVTGKIPKPASVTGKVPKSGATVILEKIPKPGVTVVTGKIPKPVVVTGKIPKPPSVTGKIPRPDEPRGRIWLENIVGEVISEVDRFTGGRLWTALGKPTVTGKIPKPVVVTGKIPKPPSVTGKIPRPDEPRGRIWLENIVGEVISEADRFTGGRLWTALGKPTVTGKIPKPPSVTGKIPKSDDIVDTLLGGLDRAVKGSLERLFGQSAQISSESKQQEQKQEQKQVQEQEVDVNTKIQELMSKLDQNRISGALRIIKYGGFPPTMESFVNAYSMAAQDKLSDAEKEALSELTKLVGKDAPIMDEVGGFSPQVKQRKSVVTGKIPKPQLSTSPLSNTHEKLATATGGESPSVIEQSTVNAINELFKGNIEEYKKKAEETDAKLADLMSKYVEMSSRIYDKLLEVYKPLINYEIKDESKKNEIFRNLAIAITGLAAVGMGGTAILGFTSALPNVLKQWRDMDEEEYKRQLERFKFELEKAKLHGDILLEKLRNDRDAILKDMALSHQEKLMYLKMLEQNKLEWLKFNTRMLHDAMMAARRVTTGSGDAWERHTTAKARAAEEIDQLYRQADEIEKTDSKKAEELRRQAALLGAVYGIRVPSAPRREKKVDVGYYKSFLGLKRQLEEQIARGNYKEARRIVEQLQEIATRAMEDTGDKTIWNAVNKMLEDPRYTILERE